MSMRKLLRLLRSDAAADSGTTNGVQMGEDQGGLALGRPALDVVFHQGAHRRFLQR